MKHLGVTQLILVTRRIKFCSRKQYGIQTVDITLTEVNDQNKTLEVEINSKNK